MRPNHGWSLGLMPRTETPPPISEGGTWEASRGEHLSHSQQSRGQSLPHARARLCARENGKSVLAIKLGPKAGCWVKAPELLIPPPVFARCRGSFSRIGAAVNQDLPRALGAWASGPSNFELRSDAEV